MNGPLQSLSDLPISWGNDYVTLVVTGLIVAFLTYKLGWSGGDDSGTETEIDQDTENTTDVDNTIDLDIHTDESQGSDESDNSPTDSESGNRGEDSSPNSLEGCINCYPKDLDDGIDPINDTRNEIPTFHAEGEAEITINWPNGHDPSWILVDGGPDVYINFKDKPPNMDFTKDRFRVGANSDIEHFDIEFSAPNLSGSQKICFIHVSTDDVLHRETLTRL